MNSTLYFSKPTACQQILIDMHGFILDSSDTIFPVERQRPVTEWSNFLASILPTLKSLRLDSPEVHFPRIHSISDSLNGLYDCSFIFAEWEDDKLMLVWNIFDFSNNADYLKQRQQKANNKAIKKELIQLNVN
jgi:hypothetical protein